MKSMRHGVFIHSAMNVFLNAVRLLDNKGRKRTEGRKR
jgi:hypothetical protein